MDFPENDFYLISGSYQLSQAVSYLAEIMDDNGIINANFLKENKGIVKFEVRSWHINRKTYKCYIEYALNTIGIVDILRYTCECANGLTKEQLAVVYMLQQLHDACEIFISYCKTSGSVNQTF